MSYTIQQPTTGNGSFQQRALTATITLGKGKFGNTGYNTITLSGLRAEATVRKGGWPGMDRAEVRLYGVHPSVMNAVSMLGVTLPNVQHNNTLMLQAGDSANGMTNVFFGYMMQVWQNFDSLPETALDIIGWGAAGDAIFPIPPTSYPAGADVATIMAGLAETMGLAFENNGVQVQLASPYFPGTAIQQAERCAKAAGIEMYIDTGAKPNTLVIWPRNRTRGGVVPLISAQSGMIGYPSYFQYGMEFSCVFNPNIRVGSMIQMQSSIGTAATYSNPSTPRPQDIVAGGPNGLWYVNGPVVHELSAWVPDGPWITRVSCSRSDKAPSAA